MQPETITPDPDLFKVMEDLYHWLNDWDRFPKAWLKAPSQVGVRAFISALRPIFVKDLEEFTSKDHLSYLAAWRAAPAANAAVMSFRPHDPPFEIPEPPPFPDLLQGTAPAAKSKKGDLTKHPASGGEDSSPAPPASVNEQGNSESTGEELQCTPCHSRFTAEELGSRRSTRACPMCGDPLVAAAPEDSGADYRWWVRENPDLHLPYARGLDFSAYVGKIVFVEVAALRVDPDPIRPLEDRTVEDIRVSLRFNPLIAPVGVTTEGRLCFGRHRYHAHVGESRRWIKAHILRDDLQTEYLALAENVARAELCALQQGVSLLRMQEIYEGLHPETKRGVAGGKAGGRGRRVEQAQNSAPAINSFCAEAAAKVGKSGRAIQTLVQIGRIAPTAQRVLMSTQAKDRQSVLLKVARAGSEAEQVALAEQIRSKEVAPPTKPATAPQEPTTLSIALREEGGVRLGEGRMGNRWVRVRVEGDLVKVEFSRATTAGPNAEASPDDSPSA